MGNGMCSRRQKRIVQALVLLAVLAALVYGAMLNYDLQNRLRRAEVLSGKYQQHQESLSAQLQVVYEHRSRLEKSLQKERLELKKAREDHLVYKLEAQETLNKGRQDSNARYNALSVQHQMLKSQHEDLRKQHSELQTEHQKLGEDLTKTFSDHKDKYVQLQQEKEQEVSKLKESIYNLREENKQLRKVHQDVHTQLQDVRNQVEEFVQLKNALNKVPSIRQLDKGTQSSIIRAMPSISPLQEHFTAQEAVALHKFTQPSIQAPQGHEHEGIVTQAKNEDETELHKGDEDTGAPLKVEPLTEHPVEVEEEHKKELEEEEMEQVGKPEKLEEDQDQIQEEQEQHRLSEDELGAAANEEEQHEEETNMLNEHEKRDQSVKPKLKYKSAYEEQLEQQKLAAQREEQARFLKQHQDSLNHHRFQEHIIRQPQVHENDLDLEKPNMQKEAPIADKMGEHEHYDHLDHDIVQGEEEQHLQEEGGAYERDSHQDEAEEGDDIVKNANEEQAIDQQPEQHEAPAEDLNPADDPNNQGEDEFEEAEQEREENLPDENEEQRQQQGQGQPEKQEHLVMAGNPDQQEDNADEQYQEEGEEEVQEELTEERKRERNGEEPYPENEENIVRKRHEALQEEPRENHDDNYEEDEEEEEEGAKNKRRAEM